MQESHWIMVKEGLDHLNQGLTIFDKNLNLVTCNEMVQTLLDLPTDLLVEGTPIEDLFRFNAKRGEYGEGDIEQQVRERVELAHQMTPHSFERVRPDGTVIQINGTPLPGGGFVTTYTDVTEQRLVEAFRKKSREDLQNMVDEQTAELKKREIELAERTEELETVLDYMSQGLTMMDADFNLAVSNPRFHELAEIPTDLGERGTPFEAFMRYNAERGEYGDGDVDEQVRLRVELAKKREPHCFERSRPDGTILEVQGVPLPNGGFVSTYTDITKRKRAEHQLREANEQMEENIRQRTAELYESQQDLKHMSEQLKIALENMEQGISYVSDDLKMVFCNEKFLEVLDFPQEYAVPGTPFENYIRRNAERGEYGPGDIDEQVAERVELAKQQKAHLFERERPDGTVIEIRGAPVQDGGFVTTYTDITERKRAEEAIISAKEDLERRVEERTSELAQREKESEEKSALLEATVEHITQGISVFDKDLKLKIFNKRFIDDLNFPREFGKVGTPLQTFFRYNAERGEYGDGDIEDQIKERLGLAENGSPHSFERRRPDGTVLQIVGRPMPENIGGFVTTYTNITELVDIQEKLRQAIEEALEANRAKSDFLSGMSHELRTPLNGILGFSQLLQHHPKISLTDQQNEYVLNIQRAGEHLLHLINEILDLSKVEAGKLELNLEGVDVHNLLKECIQLLEKMAGDRGIVIHHGLDDSLRMPVVYGDVLRLKQVFMNVVSNAIKYNVENGRIDVHWQITESDMLCVDITDTGVGIPQELQKELFKPFSRLNAETNDVEGTGLGLAITNKLVELMNGRINLFSKAGEGATFQVCLPLAKK